jgi:hypothetical protein
MKYWDKKEFIIHYKDFSYLIVMMSISLMNFNCSWLTKDMRRSDVNKNLITEDKAIEIANDAIKGRANYDKTGKITVKLKEKQYIVTFPFKKTTPASLGPDYAARVWIDSKTGKVLKLLGGS